VGSALLVVVLVPIVQVGLGYLSGSTSSPWFWLVGTPVAYLLLGGLAAFSAVGGLPAPLARSRGIRTAAVGGLLAGLFAALLTAALVFLAIHGAQTRPAQPSRVPDGLGIFVLIFFFVPAALMVNLFGVALSPLGGLLGGSLRASISHVDQTAQQPSGSRESSAVWFAMIVLAAALALLAGAAGLILSTGAFPAAR